MPKAAAPAAIRIVLADDHAVVRAGIRQFLETAGDLTVVAEAEDGESACALIAKHVPDVAILDIQMPKASGIEVTRWVRAQRLPVGVLVLTAYDDDPYVMAVLKAGANGYVLKTAAPGAILQAVRDVHAGKSALAPGIVQKLMAQVSDQSQTQPVEALSEREVEVLSLAARGYTNKAVGAQLGISDRTVQAHLARIYDKLHAASRTEAVMRAVSLGWLPPDLGQIEHE
jgi:DNA-binding NarL/FixJ family response regulator